MIKNTAALMSLVFSLLLSSTITNGQSNDKILNDFEDYTSAPRELIYTHLNKSTYIEGEMMGFTAYVFDKFEKSPSQMTKNLYCTIEDKDGNIIKKKLLQVKNGVASNVFDIDSSLSSGVFTFKAYTNWMRNFKEKNHFEQTFKVIDADRIDQISPVSADDFKIDLQILGEGGHISYGVPNVLGIIAKNQFQKGIPLLKGKIVDENDTVLSEFQLNNVGLAKTLFNPELSQTYFVKLNFNGTIIKKEISGIENRGMALSLIDQRQRILIKLEANELFKNQFQGQSFKAALHDGSQMTLIEFVLQENDKVLLSYPKSDLFSGINIFTIFTANNQPLLERSYFNMNGIERTAVETVSSESAYDSINVNLKFNLKQTDSLSHVSVSVLPKGTKSYNPPNSILSQLFIQPYIKGALERGSQYFKGDAESRYNLDLLLLTQGWSSYDWNTIFNYNEVFIYPFERGIDIVSTVNGSHPGTYVVYPMAESSTQIYTVADGDKEFTIKSRFPDENDLFRVGYLDTKDKEFAKKPSLYMQYFPSRFPEFNYSYPIPVETFQSKINSSYKVVLDPSWEGAEVLDEVVVKGKNKEDTRAEQLANKTINSRVDIMSDKNKKRNQRIDLYLQRLGFVTDFDYFSGTLTITNPRVQWGSPVPLVYLDDAFLSGAGINSDFTILTFLTTGDIDYIEYELYGVGGGIRGGAGFIKIYTDKDASNRYGRSNQVQTYEVPLTFNKEKKFYVPKYKLYNSEFFNEFGTLDWKPNLSIGADGTAQFKVMNTRNDFKLFIEGFIGDTFISQDVLVEE